MTKRFVKSFHCNLQKAKQQDAGIASVFVTKTIFQQTAGCATPSQGTSPHLDACQEGRVRCPLQSATQTPRCLRRRMPASGTLLAGGRRQRRGSDRARRPLERPPPRAALNHAMPGRRH